MSNSENGVSSDNQQQKSITSLDPACNDLKHAYDACFNSWFTESFLKGGHKGTETPCDDILRVYSECVKTAIEAKNIALEDLSSDAKKTDPPTKSSSSKS